MESLENPNSASSDSSVADDFQAADNPDKEFFVDPLPDDGRSSSLSDIDDGLDNEQLDLVTFPKPEKAAASEFDSEAETERIEDSPHHPRNRSSIVLSAGTFETSPSKLAQSVTYDELKTSEENNRERLRTPSRPSNSLRSNGVIVAPTEEEVPVSSSSSSTTTIQLTSTDTVDKKRKRVDYSEETTAEPEERAPFPKRRGSVRTIEAAEKATSLPEVGSEVTSQVRESSNDETTATEEVASSDARIETVRGRKGKKLKKKGKIPKDASEDAETESIAPSAALENDSNGIVEDVGPAEEDGNAEVEVVEDADETEGPSKMEEEAAKKTTAMELLVSLEREFAILRDRIYDERIANLNKELEQLDEANPTHPEYLRQLCIVEKYRDDKMQHEHTLFSYKLKSLCNRGLAERSQINSTYFQSVRDVREKHLETISALHYRIQQDRFQNADASPDYGIAFPKRRSKQIAQQAAYNKEVSVLAGVAKYVGFPAAPALQPARQDEIDEDFEKIGIRLRPNGAVNASPLGHAVPPFPRLTSTSLLTGRAEEEFLEQTPWANPQHPIHEQYYQQLQQGRLSEQQQSQQDQGTTEAFHGHSFTTPASQQRVVDVNANQGSASTIVENPSIAGSSTNNTPYNLQQEDRAALSRGGGGKAEVDEGNLISRVDGGLGFSPLDVRKSNTSRPRQPQSTGLLPSRLSPGPRTANGTATPTGPRSAKDDIMSFSPPPRTLLHSSNPPAPLSSSSSRAGLFGSSAQIRRDSSPNSDLLPPSSSTPRPRASPLTPLHKPAGITAGGQHCDQ